MFWSYLFGSDMVGGGMFGEAMVSGDAVGGGMVSDAMIDGSLVSGGRVGLLWICPFPDKIKIIWIFGNENLLLNRGIY